MPADALGVLSTLHSLGLHVVFFRPVLHMMKSKISDPAFCSPTSENPASQAITPESTISGSERANFLMNFTPGAFSGQPYVFRPPSGDEDDEEEPWWTLPHFNYRRILHEYFANFHIYHPEWLPRGSTVAAMANIAASTAGIGTFAMPYAAARCGVAYFIVGMVATISLMTYSQHIVNHVIDKTNLHSYEMITRRAFADSRFAEIVVEALLISNCFGGTVASIVIVGDGAKSILTGTGALIPESVNILTVVIQLGIFLFVMLPLSIPRTLGTLKYASSFGVLALGTVVVYAIVRGFYALNVDHLHPLTDSFLSFSVGTSLLFFGFNNQFNTIEIYSELDDRTPRRFTIILLATMVLMCALYIVMGLVELMEFGSSVTGNILNSYDGGSPLASVMIAAVQCKVILSYPLLLFPTREALLHLFGVSDVRKAPQSKYLAATLCIAFGSFGIAIAAPKVVTLFGLIGSLCVGTFAFILPSLYFWKFSVCNIVAGASWERVVHVAVNIANFGIGVFIVFAGTGAALVEL